MRSPQHRFASSSSFNSRSLILIIDVGSAVGVLILAPFGMTLLSLRASVHVFAAVLASERVAKVFLYDPPRLGRWLVVVNTNINEKTPK